MGTYSAAPMAHVAPGVGEIIGLLFVSLAALFGLATFVLFESKERGPHRRALATGAAVLTGASVVLAYAFPLIIKGPSTLFRPHATARLAVRSPSSGEVFRGDPAMVPIEMVLMGGKLVPGTTRKVVPNVGHIHVYLDGDLLSMSTSMRDQIEVRPGEHLLEAEFVAGDHGPFNPRVRAKVSFSASP